MRKREDNCALVGVKASKHQTTQAVKRLDDMDTVKVSTLLRLDGDKKAYIPLAPDYDALDVARKIRITETESS
ncbi:60S ribosomal protein L23a [Galemys pyrenaicus]|uniref:60S ribosomal protein L23a n=1 Tax=Galemys pyrenaicus TaxID=202257 RepID=A0A8J6DX65_GALPY|nr:60S ribosomal protein L23a [Galemys pyrenaicus]